MNFKKVVLYIIFFTVIGLVYVNQQVKIIITSYEIQRNEEKLNSLVDKNTELKYNISKLNSPSYLLSVAKHSKGNKFKLSRNFKVKYLNVKNSPKDLNMTAKSDISFLSFLLGKGTEVEAEPVGK